MEGEVVRKRYNTVWIKWANGIEQTHYADHMEQVFTPEQLKRIEEENRVVEKVKQYQQEQLKKPLKRYPW